MTRGLWFIFPAALALGACDRSVPDDTGAGVGFGDYATYEQTRRQEQTVQLPTSIATGTETVIPPSNAGAPGTTDIASLANSAINNAQTPQTPAPQASVPQAPQAQAPVAAAPPSNNAAISDEQDFDAVAARETIETDAERLARMAQQRVEIAPTDLPDRPGSTGPNIVEYALSTTNPVGTQIYRRSSLRAGRHEENCLSYQSADLAQQAFLSMGGPERDRQALDPDGDGYACSWDPNIYRNAARSG